MMWRSLPLRKELGLCATGVRAMGPYLWPIRVASTNASSPVVEYRSLSICRGRIGFPKNDHAIAYASGHFYHLNLQWRTARRSSLSFSSTIVWRQYPADSVVKRRDWMCSIWVQLGKRAGMKLVSAHCCGDGVRNPAYWRFK